MSTFFGMYYHNIITVRGWQTKEETKLYTSANNNSSPPTVKFDVAKATVGLKNSLTESN